MLNSQWNINYKYERMDLSKRTLYNLQIPII